MTRHKVVEISVYSVFIDQLPKGMRETVYFKDDDTRLSFLQGNYVTLTNMSDEEIDRLIKKCVFRRLTYRFRQPIPNLDVKC